jgi:flavin reductase
MDSDQFKRGMRRLASGVSLITTVNQGVRHGLVATAVSSVTADPPTLLVCINRNASAHAHVEEAGILCVNVLSDAHQDVAARFSSSTDRHLRFEQGDWREIETGAPGLANSLASFDCIVRQVVPYHSHSIFLAEIVGVELWADTSSPLLYMDGRYRMLADAQKVYETVG